jgi:BioD-like phosphotransacetylase family protein
MSITIIASSEPRVGRSLIAAAIAFRIGRAGTAVTLVRLSGDDSAAADAAAFAALEGVVTPGRAVAIKDVRSLSGEIIVEAPPGPVQTLATELSAPVVEVATPTSAATDASPDKLQGRVFVRVPDPEVGRLVAQPSVLALLQEDRVLAAPAVADIAAAIEGQWLAGQSADASVSNVMIGTVASDAAGPYFGNRARTCVVTRFDKTDVQLAALQTDLACLILTGGGAPSPYLLDRVRSSREDISVLAARGSTVDTIRAMESLFCMSRFEGNAKLARAVELLDAAGLPERL